jgi:hypothetical protein
MKGFLDLQCVLYGPVFHVSLEVVRGSDVVPDDLENKHNLISGHIVGVDIPQHVICFAECQGDRIFVIFKVWSRNHGERTMLARGHHLPVLG